MTHSAPRPTAVSRLNASRIPVLMYHRVEQAGNPWERIYSVPPQRFRAHMQALASAGYRACSCDEFVAWQRGEQDLPPNSILITFDDGYSSVFEHAMPMLQELGWTATVFVITGLVGGKDVWCRSRNHQGATYSLLDAEQLRTLHDAGFGLHTHSLTHAILTEQNDADLERELIEPKRHLDDWLGEQPRFLAYPYGKVDQRVADATRRAAYSAAFSTRSGFNRVGDDLFGIRRIEVFGSDTPRQLLRKVRLGTNDGSLAHFARYYWSRLFDRLITRRARP